MYDAPFTTDGVRDIKSDRTYIRPAAGFVSDRRKSIRDIQGIYLDWPASQVLSIGPICILIGGLSTFQKVCIWMESRL
jgi:hypothetical protein